MFAADPAHQQRPRAHPLQRLGLIGRRAAGIVRGLERLRAAPPKRNTCGVSARHRPLRSTVARPRSPPRRRAVLMVSATGAASRPPVSPIRASVAQQPRQIRRRQARPRGVVHQHPVVASSARPPSARRPLSTELAALVAARNGEPLAVRRRAATRGQHASPGASATTMPAQRGSARKRRSAHSITVRPSKRGVLLGNRRRRSGAASPPRA